LEVYFGIRPFEAYGLFFDKDGTLVDLHHQSSTLMDKRVEKFWPIIPKKKKNSGALSAGLLAMTLMVDGPPLISCAASWRTYRLKAATQAHFPKILTTIINNLST
jgi:phosphoglycolate phosphatase-like HAD superfamily hydrolase